MTSLLSFEDMPLNFKFQPFSRSGFDFPLSALLTSDL
jgi:hypothetical protein